MTTLGEAGSVVVHDARMEKDMRHMFIDNHAMEFDRVFGAEADNDEVYAGTAAELVRLAASGGRYEIDFLDFNFRGSAAMTEDVYAAERWYAGMARAATERNVTIQYCLPSATDMLVSLPYPSVVQARASGDYVSSVANVAQLGGSSLLMGAVGIAPSKVT